MSMHHMKCSVLCVNQMKLKQTRRYLQRYDYNEVLMEEMQFGDVRGVGG